MSFVKPASSNNPPPASRSLYAGNNTVSIASDGDSNSQSNDSDRSFKRLKRGQDDLSPAKKKKTEAQWSEAKEASESFASAVKRVDARNESMYDDHVSDAYERIQKKDGERKRQRRARLLRLARSRVPADQHHTKDSPPEKKAIPESASMKYEMTNCSFVSNVQAGTTLILQLDARGRVSIVSSVKTGSVNMSVLQLNDPTVELLVFQ